MVNWNKPDSFKIILMFDYGADFKSKSFLYSQMEHDTPHYWFGAFLVIQYSSLKHQQFTDWDIWFIIYKLNFLHLNLILSTTILLSKGKGWEENTGVPECFQWHLSHFGDTSWISLRSRILYNSTEELECRSFSAITISGNTNDSLSMSSKDCSVGKELCCVHIAKCCNRIIKWRI